MKKQSPATCQPTTPRGRHRHPSGRLVGALIAVGLAIVTPSLQAAKGGGKGKPGGGGGGGGGGDGGNDTPPLYGITEIAKPADVSYHYAHAMNSDGHVVGYTERKKGRFDDWGPAFIWKEGTTTSLPPVGTDPVALALAISDTGLIVGNSREFADQNTKGRWQAVWWKQQQAGYEAGDWNQFLPAGAPYRLHSANSITRNGEFVVFYAVPFPDDPEIYDLAVVARVIFDATGLPIGFAGLWTINALDGIDDLLDQVDANDISDGFALDESGPPARVIRVTGWYGIAGGTLGPFGFVWELDVVSDEIRTTDLNPSPVQDARYSEGRAVNASGEVAYLLEPEGEETTRAETYYWSGDPEPSVYIGTLGGSRSYAEAIDDDGKIVGWTKRADESTAAFLWDPQTGTMADLNALAAAPSNLSYALDINGDGQILVYGSGRSFLLTPNETP